MSCSCNSLDTEGQLVCYCDRLEHPRPLHIGAGLPALPRQIAGFPEFRRAMLYALHQDERTDEGLSHSSKSDLSAWKARKQDDLGVMLLEMWAYVCDALTFYDKVIAQEAYLRTAQRRPSIRRLVALLGYWPYPAVAATVQLTALADGRQPVRLPAGTAFRSGAFDGNPPQVFELDADTIIHPLTNRWTVQTPQPSLLQTANPGSVLIVPRTEVKSGHWLLLLDSGNPAQNQGWSVLQVQSHAGADGRSYTKITLQSPAVLGAGTPLARLQLLLATQSAGLWTVAGADKSVTDNQVVLDGLYRSLKPGQYILISRGAESRWYQISQTTEVIRQQTAPVPILINKITFSTPGVSVPVTALTLDRALNDPDRKTAGDWTDAQRAELVVHYGMQPAGTLTNERKTTLAATDALLLNRPLETPVDGHHSASFVLSDKNKRGILVGGNVNFLTGELTLNQGTNWQPELTLPVDVFGNVITASRGEWVNGEILGSGDASAASQTFKLKKKPLTYRLAPTAANEQGVQSTLQVFVNGVRWIEVPSFYGRTETDPVYIIRQNDEGDSWITFGDGIRGSRLPAGANNIVASYRFGAGKAAPPAGSINQIARPVKGLQSVNNPVAAAGGADADTTDGMRTHAPKSALLLGRAVSMADLEAAALAMPGVQAVQTEWRWHGTKQTAVVHIWYIGEAGIESALSQRLRNLSDPAIVIRVERAQAIPTTLALSITVDPRYVEANVLTTLRRTLLTEPTGVLTPQRLGIGRPLFRSQLFDTILATEGATAVQSISWNGLPFADWAKTPGAGRYFAFDSNGLLLNGNR